MAKIAALHEALGITSVAELKAAAEAGQIKSIKGFGAKTEQRLLETIANHRERKTKEQRLQSYRALASAEQVRNYLATGGAKLEIEFAGSLRRWKETIETIRLVAKTKEPESLVKYFLVSPHRTGRRRN